MVKKNWLTIDKDGFAMAMELNVILAFSQIVINKTEEEQREIAKQLHIDYDEYKRRIRGKEKEAEFLIIMKSMGCLKHLEAFDESVSHLTNEYTPDFKAELIDGYKVMIEVKHTDKDMFKISSGNLDNRLDFAKRNNLPLRFAVSIKGFWGLFTAEDLKRRGGKLSINDFAGEKSISWWDKELETCSYMFPQNIRIRSVYSQNHKKGTMLSFEPYGNLVSYELYCNDKRIFRLKGKNSQYLTHTIYLEALQNRLANSQQIINNSGDVTVVTESFKDEDVVNIIPEYEFLMAPISHIVNSKDSTGIRYNELKALADKDFVYFDKLTLRRVISFLVEQGVEIIVFKDSNGYRFEDYRELFWKK